MGYSKDSINNNKPGYNMLFYLFKPASDCSLDNSSGVAMNKIIPVVLCALAVTGCVGTVKPVALDKTVVQDQIKDSPVSVIVFEEPPFDVFTPGDVAGGGLIDNMTRPDGSSIKLPSPSYLMAKALSEDLTGGSGLSLQEVPNTLTPVPGKKQKMPSGKGYYLGVFIDQNVLGYMPTAWSTYRYILRGHAGLYSPEGALLWQKGCAVIGDGDTPELQIYRTEFKSDPDKLVNIMNIATDRCAQQLSDDFMGKTAPKKSRKKS
jgi:hypothetical protein